MDGQGGYHPETEAISPTLPTASHDSKSDMVSSISQVDREIIQIENQLQQLEKEQVRVWSTLTRLVLSVRPIVIDDLLAGKFGGGSGKTEAGNH